MKVYLVGGAVRDTMMGNAAHDHDYVVVGSSVDEMLSLGFQLVGESFPVFLRDDGAEFALARRERKVAPGYHGFEVDFDSSVTLEEDLSRRDLTINAMAMDSETGELIDPFNGWSDLDAKVLRHVSTAFAEDPLRVIRLARFYARFSDFTIHPDTITLAKQLVDNGELDALADERMWAEMQKTFEQAADPLRFFQALWSFGAMHNVKFFKDMFGFVTIAAINDMSFTMKAVKLLNLSPEEALLHFVAHLNRSTGRHTGLVIPNRVKQLIDNVQFIRNMNWLVTPRHVVDFLNKNRAWDVSNHAIPDVLTNMRILCVAGTSSVLSYERLNEIVKRGQKVSAEPYLHLPGAEIGKAIAAERLAIATRIMKG